ncbi:MAG: SPFH domain-containing protein [Rhodanobacteraceae bacterium]
MLLQLTLILALLLVAALLASAFKRIPEGQVYSLYRFGRPARMLDAGIHVVLPLIDRVAHKISLAGHAMRMEASRPSGDLQLAGTVYWQVLEPDRADAVIDNAEDLIRSTTLDALTDAAAGHDESPHARNARIKHTLNQHLRQSGMLVTRVDLHAGNEDALRGDSG